MLDIRLFRVPTFTGAQITAFAISAGMFALFLFLPLYLESVLGYSAVRTGVHLPAAVAASRSSSRRSPGACRRACPVRILLGGGLALCGVALLLMHGLTVSSTASALIPGFVVAGIGIGFVNAPLASTAVSVVEPRHAGMASGINNTFRQIGIATGIAALGAIFQSRIESSLVATHSLPPNVVQPFAQAIASGAGRRRTGPCLSGHVKRRPPHSAFISGLNTIFARRGVRPLRGRDPRLRARAAAGLRRERPAGRRRSRLGRCCGSSRASRALEPKRELPGGDEEHHRRARHDDQRLSGDRERDRVCRADAAEREDRGARARLGRSAGRGDRKSGGSSGGDEERESEHVGARHRQSVEQEEDREAAETPGDRDEEPGRPAPPSCSACARRASGRGGGG